MRTEESAWVWIRCIFSDEQVYGKDGNPQPFGTPEEILEAGQKMYGELFKRDKGIFSTS